MMQSVNESDIAEDSEAEGPESLPQTHSLSPICIRHCLLSAADCHSLARAAALRSTTMLYVGCTPSCSSRG